MNSETDYLITIAGEIAANIHSNKDITKANHHLLMEAKRLEKAIIHDLSTIENFTQRDTFYFNTLSKLVNICDQLYESTGSINLNAMVLIDLLTAVRQVLPNEIRPNLKLPQAFILLQKDKLTKAWQYHCQLMAEQKITGKLIDIAHIPFQRFIEPKVNLYWGDFTWLKGYQAKLNIMDWENADCNSPEEALLSLLIGRDFNDDRLFIYCKKYIKERTNKVQGKRRRLLEYAQCEKLVQEDSQIGMPSYDARANSVSTRLSKWIREEIDFIETHERDKPSIKFEFKWNVEMIAFFFKLLHERQTFGKLPLERFAETIAANCSSVGKEEFQPATIHSRFYMKDLQVIKAIESLLVDMLETVRKYLR
jgi:hypothetical protein